MTKNPWLLNRRLINAKGEFVSMLDFSKTTTDPDRALMASQQQIDNVMRLHPELASFSVQEVMHAKKTVMR